MYDTLQSYLKSFSISFSPSTSPAAPPSTPSTIPQAGREYSGGIETLLRPWPGRCSRPEKSAPRQVWFNLYNNDDDQFRPLIYGC